MSDTDRDPRLPERLPIENFEQGLYIHQACTHIPEGTHVTTLTDSDGSSRYLVDAQEFMLVQCERDNYRRTCALINAWRCNPERSEGSLTRLLEDAGLTAPDGLAMCSIIAQVQGEVLAEHAGGQ